MHRVKYLLSLLSLPTLVFAEPVVETNIKYYEIQGSSPYELRHQLDDKSPVILDGERLDADTEWDVHWNFKWSESKNQCKIDSVTTRVNVEYTLPEWVNRDTSRRRLREKWDRYYTALKEHEKGHKDIGFEAAYDIEEAIAAMKPEAHCQKLEKQANALAESIIHQYVKRDKKYDRITRHGLDQGATFP
ncbi:DUF922 domain-containing Zn-dependent protease [Endozoicomonas numazuensis]|uniref:DUF922 domain-containing Zn-dependent protease n=1 Tax=Endozoicomonas numazuensis TaxID=1137799 RepID=UPI00068A2B50|nr:DUF922 domain-containing Zn-dependent protease [Endozoicomonas numazuensis]